MKIEDIIINKDILACIAGCYTFGEVDINPDFDNMLPENCTEEEAIKFLEDFYTNEIEYIDDQFYEYDFNYGECYYHMIIRYNNEYYMILYCDDYDSCYQTDVETLADCKKCKPELVTKYFAI